MRSSNLNSWNCPKKKPKKCERWPVAKNPVWTSWHALVSKPWDCRPISPQVQKKHAPGQFTKAIPHQKPRVLFTPTSSEALSGQKSFRSKTSWQQAPWPKQKRKAKSDSKVRTTSCEMEMSLNFYLMFKSQVRPTLRSELIVI